MKMVESEKRALAAVSDSSKEDEPPAKKQNVVRHLVLVVYATTKLIHMRC